MMAGKVLLLSTLILLLAATGICGNKNDDGRDNGKTTESPGEDGNDESKNLKCYQCGSYSTSGSGSVAPCHRYDETNLKPCKDTDTHCVKYVNEGIIVRQCLADCKTGTYGLTELYCCNEDGCNGASTEQPHMMAVLTAIISVGIYVTLL